MPDPTPPTVALNRMNAADTLVLLVDVVGSLKAHGFIVLGSDGHWTFSNPTTGQILSEVVDIEAVLKNHGLAVSEHVDRIIKALPLFLNFLGQ